MKKEFNQEIKSSFSFQFKTEENALYVLTIRASCTPGWKNKWWLKFKGLLEDTLDLHLDDEDLRVEIDDTVFKKSKSKQGLFNSPAAFSGTKTLGKTKTIVFIFYLTKDSHTIKFIPDGSPYLESLEITKLNNSQKFISYLNVQAENENYYSWFTFTLVDFSLESVSITAQAGIKEEEKDDDDLKIVINGETQKNLNSRHQHSYFCGFTLKGKEETFVKNFNLGKDTHYIEFFADRTPILKIVKLLLQEEKSFKVSDPAKKEESFSPSYVMKDSAFINSHSMSEEEIEKFLKQYGENYPKHLYQRFFDGKKTSFWIKKFTTEFEINPRIILAKLQIEGRLVMGELSVNPSQEQLDWALGVGKTDEDTILRFKGFLVQLKEGTLLFRKFFEELKSLPFTFENVDGRPLTVINRATYSFYRYTPHIEGADLFYRIYDQFFAKDDLGGKI